MWVYVYVAGAEANAFVSVLAESEWEYVTESPTLWGVGLRRSNLNKAPAPNPRR